MCVKYAPGSDIEERDMSPAVFSQLLPSLSGVQSMILNGIGESLLHPNLIEFIRLARQKMGTEAEIGLQSNALLITERYADQMIEAGLSTLCLSVDSLSNENCNENSHLPGNGHSFRAVEKAVGHLQRSRTKYDTAFSLGLEVILAAETIAELPDIIRWAAENGIDYILTSHLLHYDQSAAQSTLFSPYNKKTRDIIRHTVKKAESLGYDFFNELKIYRTFAGTRSSKETVQLMNNLQQELIRHDLRCNFETLTAEQIDCDEKIRSLFRQAESLANDAGIDLFLPELFALSEKQCRFIEEQTVFIAANGDVMPCHFLWHSYACRVFNEELAVAKRIFGNLERNSLSVIWNSEEYRDFRNEAGKYDYAPCWHCGAGPCPTLVNAHDQYANDCFGSRVPCGHCQWNLGGIRCL